jgi:phosphate starvation-inducible PhoH-like protein
MPVPSGTLQGDDKLLRELEAALDVRVTSRDGWLRIEGGEEGVTRARKVFEQLDEARKRGVVIRRPEFNYAVHAAGRNGGADLGRLLDVRIQTSARKPSIVPKTDGQKAYLLAMRARDITFGIGPAGTGKTYLAMAMAVSALKQEKVSRIILTRPAVEAGEALGFLPGDLQEKILRFTSALRCALRYA